MRVLVAADKFRGTLSAEEATSAIARGLSGLSDDATVDRITLADGGEGTLEILTSALGGSIEQVEVHDLIGDRHLVPIGLLDEGAAVVESAACALPRPGPSAPLEATTYPVGEAVVAALRLGRPKVLVGIGGTVSTDGGTGAARALGWRFLDDTGAELAGGGGALRNLARVVAPTEAVPNGVGIVGLCDVHSPLLGESGSARRFGPQKGADPAQVEMLEEGLARLAAVVRRDVGFDMDALASGGAGGGLAAGLAAFTGAELRSGAGYVGDALDLPVRIGEADIVVTGEGAFDRSSTSGKVTGHVAESARRAGTRAWLVAGRIDVDDAVVARAGFERWATLETLSGDVLMADPAAALEAAVRGLAQKP